MKSLVVAVLLLAACRDRPVDVVLESRAEIKFGQSGHARGEKQVVLGQLVCRVGKDNLAIVGEDNEPFLVIDQSPEVGISVCGAVGGVPVAPPLPMLPTLKITTAKS